MRKALLGIVCLVGCETPPPNEHVCLWWDFSQFGGAGAGGAGGGGGGAAGAGGAGCEMKEAFLNSDLCFEPTEACCALQSADLDALCDSTTIGQQPVPVSCLVVPPLPSSVATDGRTCVAVEIGDLGCTWGTASLLCCEP